MTTTPTPPPWPCPGWSVRPEPGEWVWKLADSDWRAGGDGLTCAQRDCRRSAVMVLLRRVHGWRRRSHVRRWGCCEQPSHGYGRVVHDGHVWEPGRPEWSTSSPNDPSPNQEPTA